jgi:hypothetical protein
VEEFGIGVVGALAENDAVFVIETSTDSVLEVDNKVTVVLMLKMPDSTEVNSNMVVVPVGSRVVLGI